MPRGSFKIKEETRAFTSPRTSAVEIVRELDDCDSVLDVGCGKRSFLRFLSCERLVGMDAYQPDLDCAKESQTHDEFVLGDARNLSSLFQSGEFDACVSLDVIEHLSKEDGLEFLKELERVAKRKVVIFTPNGFLRQSNTVDGDYQEHISGWDTEEMRALGYRVTGLLGLKGLRTEYHRLRYHPAPLWAGVSLLSQHLWCRNHPESAAAILCVKDLDKADSLPAEVFPD